MKILVPVDGSEAALDAVRHALQLWREGLNANLELANIQDPTSLNELMLAPGPGVLEKITGAAGASALSDAEALCLSAGITFHREVAAGEPAPVLIEIARRPGCDAIIIGARGLGALRGALLDFSFAGDPANRQGAGHRRKAREHRVGLADEVPGTFPIFRRRRLLLTGRPRPGSDRTATSFPTLIRR